MSLLTAVPFGLGVKDTLSKKTGSVEDNDGFDLTGDHAKARAREARYAEYEREAAKEAEERTKRREERTAKLDVLYGSRPASLGSLFDGIKLGADAGSFQPEAARERIYDADARWLPQRRVRRRQRPAPRPVRRDQHGRLQRERRRDMREDARQADDSVGPRHRQHLARPDDASAREPRRLAVHAPLRALPRAERLARRRAHGCDRHEVRQARAARRPDRHRRGGRDLVAGAGRRVRHAPDAWSRPTSRRARS